jgi:hypothetical protein
MPTFQTLIAGRAISCSFTAEDLTKYRILNVYAPPEATERQIFFQYLLDYIQKNWGGDQIIMGGDMNTVLDSSIDRRPTKAPLVPLRIKPNMDDAGSGALRRLVTVMGMQDIYRKTHPTARQYTCRNVSRIDQWYATKTVGALCSSDHPIPPPVPSDHNLILMTISSSDNILRGPGTWKANPGNWTSQEIREQINRILSDPKLLNQEDPFLTWLLVKREIKSILQAEGQRQASQRRENMAGIQDEIKAVMSRMVYTPVVMASSNSRINYTDCNGSFNN